MAPGTFDELRKNWRKALNLFLMYTCLNL